MPGDGGLQTETQGFISYRRVDNEDFDRVVDEIRRKLSALFEAQTGQKLKLFIDRESIGWGEDWRNKIDASVRNATVFIPVITLRYFNSQACLDELTAFEATARNLGVTDLLLPLVLFGADQIDEQDERPEVRLIARLNYKPIEGAWAAGYNSAEWRSAMSDCAKSLATALSRAEDALAESEHAGVAPKDGVEGPKQPSGAATSPGGEELGDDVDIELMGQRLVAVTEKLEGATALVEELGEVANGAFGDVDVSTLTPAQVNARLLAAAHRFKNPSLRLEEAGAEVEDAMLELDPQLRAVVRHLGTLQIDAAQQQLEELFEGISTGAAELKDTEAQIQGLIETIQFISLMNVSVRKALRPAVRGMRSFLTALGVFDSWRALAE